MIVLCGKCQIKCNANPANRQPGDTSGGCAFCGLAITERSYFAVFDIGIVPGPSILEDRAGWLKMGIMKAQHSVKMAEEHLQWEKEQLAWAKGQVANSQRRVEEQKKYLQEHREWLEELLQEGSTLRGRKKVS